MLALTPTRRLVTLAFVATLVATLAGFVAALRVPLFVLDFVIVAAALGDALALLGKRVEAERTAAAIFSIGRANVVTMTVRSRAPLDSRVLSLTVSDDPLGDTTTEGLPATLDLGPQKTATIKYEITPTRRGPRTFGAITVRYPGPLGLFSRRERFELPADVDVYPDVHAARSLELLRRQGRKDARMGSLRVRGGDTDFERLRPYAQGDEPRHVDWRATARRDDVTVRQYQAEADQNVVFAIDVGRSMRGRAEKEGIGIVDHAINAALLAADVAARAGDKAGLVVFDDAPRTWLPPTSGRNGSRKLTRAVYALDAGLSATDYRAAFGFLRAQIKSRSLVIIFTNVLEPRSAKDLASAVRTLMPRHLPLCVLMRDPDIEALALSEVRREDDLFVRAAAADALTFREDLIRSLRNAGVLVLDTNPGDLTPELVKSYLEVKARRLL